MENLKCQIHNERARLIARVLRGLLAGERFETYADLLEAIKVKLARLRIRYQLEDLLEALRLVESNRELLEPLERPQQIGPRSGWINQAPAISKQEAAALLEALGANVKGIR